MSRLAKITLWIVLVLVVFSVIGFFVVPPVAKSMATKKLSQSLHRDVALERIRFNPYTLCLSIQGFSVKERGSAETFLSFQELFVNLEALSLAKRAVILKEVRLEKPFVRIVRSRDESYNFSDLLKEEKPEEEEEESKPLHYSINNISIVSGEIDFRDDLKNTHHTAKDINIGLPFISNASHYTETFVDPSLSATINGAAYILKGRTKPFKTSRETVFDIDIRDFDIPHYLAYVPAKMNFSLVSARLDAATRLTFRQVQKGQPMITLQGDITLKDIVLEDLTHKPFVSFPLVSVDMASVKPLAGEIHLSKVAVDAPKITVERDKKGEINLLRLSPGEGKEEQKRDGEETKVDVDEVIVSQGEISFRDAAPSKPFMTTLSDISLKAGNISTGAGREGPVALSFSLPKKGTCSLEGPLQITPLSAKLSLAVKDLFIPAFQPYVSDVLNVQITGGRLSANGELLVSSTEEKGLATRYAGKMLISRFASVDKDQAGDLVKWNALYLNGMDVRHNPLSVTIGEVALSDFYTRILINADGTLNLQNLAVGREGKGKEEPSKPIAEAEKLAESLQETRTAGNIAIGAVTLQGGEIDFADRYIQPNFSGRLIEIGGRVSGLSSGENTKADVELRGKLEGYAPLEVTGTINPLREDLFVDLKATFKNMDLSPVTPYAGKYIGYTIQKGKLSFDLKYLIAQRKLDSQNNIFIDQLTLGDRVESPDATTLPVSLAISLLKDRNDQIRLDIPVQGTLDDPEFSVWRIIIQVLVNILTKAATSPFALLGSLVGGGEELSFIEFEDGAARLADENLVKLETIGKALADRPALKLDIEGYADAKEDREGLKNELFQRKLRVQKIRERAETGEADASPDDVVINPDEYETYLKMAYDAETFPKPRNVLGMVKSLPVQEMEKLMLTSIEVNDEDLRRLASQRALKVRDVLLKFGEVTPDRVFIIDTDVFSPPEKENVKKSRVDFRLK